MSLKRTICFVFVIFFLISMPTIADIQDSETRGTISGALLMLDNKTPHVSVVVQLVTPVLNDESQTSIIATTLSDEDGKYKFINLRTGQYQVRCHTLGTYIYYNSQNISVGQTLSVRQDKLLENIDFRIAPFKKGTWTTYSALDGLVHNDVLAIHRQPNGLMWFGTRYGGISRYDGKEFVNFTTKDGLINNRAYAVFGDSNGMMWFGTLGGVSRYDGKEFVNFTTKDGLPHNQTFAIHQDSNDTMWFGTLGGVSRYDGKEFVNFTTKDGLPHNAIRSIEGGSGGVLWFATYDELGSQTGNGISRYDGKEFTNFTTKDGLPSNIITTIHQGPDGILWFGTSSGISRYDGRTFVNFTTEDGLPGNSVRTIDHDSDGVMWLATFDKFDARIGNGISRYDGRTFVNFTIEDGLASNSVYDIFSDQHGVIWFATDDSAGGGGISRYDGRTFVNFTTEDGLANNTIYAMHRQQDGVMWFGTFGGGVSRYDGKEFINFTTKDGLVSNNITTIHRDLDGTLWFGAWGGISRYDGEEFTSFTSKDGLASNSVTTIYQEPDGAMWFGTYGGGVSRYDGKEFINFTTKDGLAHNYIWGAINSTPHGAPWFGTLAGASKYDGGKFVHLTTKDGLVSDNVKSIHHDFDGFIWFGTEGGGISRYDGREFTNFTVDDGLANNAVTAIHQSPNGVLWFGTFGSGVMLYDNNSWSSIDNRDGLAGNTVSSIYQGVDDFLWFGTREGGITRYRSNLVSPSVRILSVKVGNRYIHPSTIPTLTVGSRLTIVSRAIDFKTIAEKQRYRYRIQEIDTNWRPPTTEPFFDYTPGEPGTYTFYVQSIDRDLIYSEPAKFSFRVELPWYLNGWVIFPSSILVLLILILAIVNGVRYYQQRRKSDRLDREKQLLRDQMLEKEKEARLSLESELADAYQIQMSLLPKSAPEIKGLEISGRSIAAKEVGGDFFDYLISEDELQICIAVGDVSGKGLRGAMNAVMASGILRLASTENPRASMDVLMSKLNKALCQNMERDMNVTMVLAQLDTDKKQMALANAGQHAYPLLVRNGVAAPVKAKGLALGMIPTISYKLTTVDVKSGDLLLFMTDGITEPRSVQGLMYQESGRLDEVLSNIQAEISADSVLDMITSDVMNYSVDDDLTLVVVRVL